MPRLFTGVEIPTHTAFGLSLMRGGIAGARWIDPSSYHITLRFIGDISLPLAQEVSYALDEVVCEPFSLRLSGMNVLGGNKPHTLCAPVEEKGELKRLQATHERIAQVLGLPAEPRRFVPHVTLARLKDPDILALQRFVVSHSLYTSEVFEVDRFVLFSSRPSRGGGPYAVESAYHLYPDLLRVELNG